MIPDVPQWLFVDMFHLCWQAFSACFIVLAIGKFLEAAWESTRPEASPSWCEYCQELHLPEYHSEEK